MVVLRILRTHATVLSPSVSDLMVQCDGAKPKWGNKLDEMLLLVHLPSASLTSSGLPTSHQQATKPYGVDRIGSSGDPPDLESCQKTRALEIRYSGDYSYTHHHWHPRIAPPNAERTLVCQGKQERKAEGTGGLSPTPYTHGEASYRLRIHQHILAWLGEKYKHYYQDSSVKGAYGVQSTTPSISYMRQGKGVVRARGRQFCKVVNARFV